MRHMIYASYSMISITLLVFLPVDSSSKQKDRTTRQLSWRREWQIRGRAPKSRTMTDFRNASLGQGLRTFMGRIAWFMITMLSSCYQISPWALIWQIMRNLVIQIWRFSLSTWRWLQIFSWSRRGLPTLRQSTMTWSKPKFLSRRGTNGGNTYRRHVEIISNYGRYLASDQEDSSIMSHVEILNESSVKGKPQVDYDNTNTKFDNRAGPKNCTAQPLSFFGQLGRMIKV